MELVKNLRYPLEVLTLVEITENAKSEFYEIKKQIPSLIKSYGIDLVYYGDVIKQREYDNNKKYDVCLILRFNDEFIHKKYIESHKTDETLKVLLKTIKSRYDIQLSEI